MRRIDLVKQLAEKVQAALSEVFTETQKNSPTFKAFKVSMPILGAIITAVDWWCDYNKKAAIPQQAIALVCEKERIPENIRVTIKSRKQLEDLLKEHGIQDQERAFEIAVNQLFSELKYPELSQYLSDLHSEMLYEIERQFAEFKLALKRGFTNLLPIETELEILPLEILPEADLKRKPMFFRKMGPFAVDFDAGKIYRRREVDEIKQRIKENNTVLLKGVAASGKSVIARFAAYELRKMVGRFTCCPVRKGTHLTGSMYSVSSNN